jgi:aminoglycoside phosphotransferase family enzyme/predicted kinase
VDPLKQHSLMMDGLQRLLQQQSDEPVERIETHISTVLLAGDYAYKVKKPLNLGFLDFSTLERRRLCCEEELRLNGRLAPHIYLGVVAVTGSIETPGFGQKGEIIDFAVKMKRFPSDSLLSHQIDALNGSIVESIALKMAGFHGEVEKCDQNSSFGEPDQVWLPIAANFAHIRAIVSDREIHARLESVESRASSLHEKLIPLLQRRKREGHIRECHGDMHLGNIALVDGEVLIFDGIEFSPELRWIDTISEMAFLLMDLEERGHPELASLALNVYLEASGDYGAMPLLRFYQSYRAMVRAKVAAIRWQQAEESERAGLYAEFEQYLTTAERYAEPGKPALIITFGLSGSGKSTISRELMQQLPAVRVRSDIERKRIAGLSPLENSASDVGSGIYGSDFTRRTYERLLLLSEEVLSAGFAVVVDATFLKRDQRELFLLLAERLDIPFVVLDLQVSEQLLRDRVRQRAEQGGDPSEADIGVLESQLKSVEPLDGDELALRLVVSPDDEQWTAHLKRVVHSRSE